MSFPRRGTVKVVQTMRGDNIVRIMQRHRYVVEEADSSAYDFLCGSTCVVFVDDANSLMDVARRAEVAQRVRCLKAQVGSLWRYVAIVLRVGSQEPCAGVLTWLNVHCSVEQGCLVTLFWTDEECAAYLEGLVENDAAPLDYSVGVRRDNTPMQMLIEAFAQTPQLMARNDVVRAVNMFGSVGGLLTATAEEFEKLPGFAQKKAKRLHAVLNAPFVTSRVSIDDVIHGDEEALAKGVEGRPGYEAMHQALAQVHKREDEEAEENPE